VTDWGQGLGMPNDLRPEKSCGRVIVLFFSSISRLGNTLHLNSPGPMPAGHAKFLVFPGEGTVSRPRRAARKYWHKKCFWIISFLRVQRTAPDRAGEGQGEQKGGLHVRNSFGRSTYPLGPGIFRVPCRQPGPRPTGHRPGGGDHPAAARSEDLIAWKPAI
jgi:hypothetical protein